LIGRQAKNNTNVSGWTKSRTREVRGGIYYQ
jgi:hypothetical protein